MHRREILRAAAAAAALSLLPNQAQAAWARSLESLQPSPFTPLQRGIITTVADALIPRTDTPGANDVRVLQWIEVIMADYYGDAERGVLHNGLDAMDAMAHELTGASLNGLGGTDLARVMDALDGATDRTTPAVRGYLRLKGLVVHAYFTSERVQKDVLHTQIMPGRYDGAADMPTRGAGRDE
jgi:Gluconate 2-dehydrogenase subunit 3